MLKTTWQISIILHGASAPAEIHGRSYVNDERASSPARSWRSAYSIVCSISVHSLHAKTNGLSRHVRRITFPFRISQP